MNQKLTIRKLREGEELAVSRVCKRCIKEINSKDMTKKQVRYLSDYFSAKNIRESLGETRVYVALLGEKIVASGSLCEGRIKAVFVNPSYHKKGVGAKLVRYLEGILKKMGHNSTFVRSSKHAVEFYKKLGFREAEKINSPDVGEIVVMKKKLK
ncbi:GNAT family N-acetyltransferase [Patescibacteria group bacterium]|nr:GNAT family N-acetyltransferase [Patescibacteria group bacterium]MBU1682553.1 GNAT family N-acetyltransferase [Patescibacteria group bacterium]